MVGQRAWGADQGAVVWVAQREERVALTAVAAAARHQPMPLGLLAATVRREQSGSRNIFNINKLKLWQTS
jgi:hypothetical protein